MDATPIALKYICNSTDKSIDLISKLNITAKHLYSVYIVEDKWSDGSRFMPLVSIINYEGQLIGGFNNRQGLVIHDPVHVNLHPAVQSVVGNQVLFQ